MSKIKIANFLGGLNLISHPSQIKDEQMQVLENMEVRPTNIGDNLTYLALTARFSYKRLHSDNLDFIPKNLIEFGQRTAIGSPVFTGSGLNDATSGGTYSGTGRHTYTVIIDSSAASPDTFKWQKDAGAFTSGVVITAGVAQTLTDGVQITFAAGDGHTLNDQWVITADNLGTKYLVTGGFNTGNNFDLRYLKDGETTTNSIVAQSSTNSGIVSLFNFADKVFFTDGVKAWRYWNGSSQAASGFTTVTKFGIKHKNKAVYLNDVTNNKPNRMWISATGTPESVGASNFFDVGDESDPIIGAMDQIERIVVLKEKSTWVFYLAPVLVESTLLRVDDMKGSLSPLGHIWGSFGTYVYTTDAGVQNFSGSLYSPAALQIYNFLKGSQNSLAAMGFREDQILISTISSSAQTRNNRVFLLDLLEEDNEKVYQYNINFSCFCQNRGVFTFGKRLKVCEDDGTNRYIVELDQTSSTVETNIACVAKTREFNADEPGKVKKLDHIIICAHYPNTGNALTIKVYGDGSLKETLTFTPSSTGFVKHKFKPLSNVSFGFNISLQFEYTQPASNATRFALLEGEINYDLESRIDT